MSVFDAELYAAWRETHPVEESAKDPRRALLPAPVGPCGDGNLPFSLRPDGHARVLVVRQRRASVQAPPLHEVPGMATADEEAMEGDWGGLEVEDTKGLVGQVSVGGEGHGCCVGIFAHHEGGVRRNRESTGGAGPP